MDSANQTAEQPPENTLKNLTPLSSVFSVPRRDNYHEMNLFIVHFNTIPNLIHEENINCNKARRWFIQTYEAEINDCIWTKRPVNNRKRAQLDDAFYFLLEDLIVYFDIQNSSVKFLFRKSNASSVDRIIDGINKHRQQKNSTRPEILVLTQSVRGLETNSMPLNHLNIDITKNYNDDFQDIHRVITKRLSTEYDKGIVLLHGKPGTGKTSYIRHLISTVYKKIIFLPPNMASSLTNPDFIEILIENSNSILVIEDAENIVIDRNNKGESPVSAILNISDGLLSDCLNIQIICSFNTDLSQIDKALLRKGRLIARYDFDKLAMNKAQALSDKLGFKTAITEPMTLSSIYNQEELEFHKKPAMQIGFSRNAVNK